MTSQRYTPGDRVQIMSAGEWIGPYTVTDKVGRTPDHLVLTGTSGMFEHYDDTPYNTRLVPSLGTGDFEYDLIATIMRTAGLPDVGVENTGGGVVVATSTTPDLHGIPAGTVCVTLNEPGSGPGEPGRDAEYLVGIAPGNTWHEGPGEDMVYRTVTGLTALGEAAASAHRQIMDGRTKPMPLLAWQFDVEVDFTGAVDIEVPGGIIRVSPDHPTGVYGGFYLVGEDGHADHPSSPTAGRGPLTFTNAGVWDVDRIVSVLRDPEHTGREQILDDYCARAN